MTGSLGPAFFGMFVKEPVAGQVKTRLATGLGGDDAAHQHAAALYSAFQIDLADRFRHQFDQRVLGFAPSGAAPVFEQLGQGDYELWVQPETGLGERMQAWFDDAFSREAGRVVLIGSDSPTLPLDYVQQAFDALKTHDVVIGPSTDGGYVLVGQSVKSHDIFAGIEFSQPSVLAETVAAVSRIFASLHLLTPWYDIDTVDDLNMMQGHIAAMRIAGQGDCSATEAALGGDAG